QRWSHNLGLVALNTVLVRLLFPVAAVGVAAFAATEQWGVIKLLDLSVGAQILLTLVVMDFAIWLQHVVVHAIPLLWRLHRVHHADLDYDVTTGARFHPIEIVLSMVIKFSVILLLGPPVAAVVLFEVTLNAVAMFNHGNIRLPVGVDTVLRWLFVTPDMHRVHHSVNENEANSNFGFNLSCWDRIFGTYQQQPKMGQQGVQFGIEGFNEPKEVNQIVGMLKLPFKGDVDHYAINRRSWQSGEDQNG
ncbi:MAG TPA: sterol desaturase family protein, partial [Gammaproteobacteria bacterium]|nr:sterol desaturase family protein [Gammaproteobacteria bacterium]